jgi:hypothetical protein
LFLNEITLFGGSHELTQLLFVFYLHLCRSKYVFDMPMVVLGGTGQKTESPFRT